MLTAEHAVNKLLSEYEFESVLDIGCGEGLHSDLFVQHGKMVTAMDYGQSLYFSKKKDTITAIIADFNTYQFDGTFDCVWAAHVLEHQLEPHRFLTKIHSILRDGGVLAVTVPPLKHTIVGGHVSLWNAGLLLYRLVLAGFDCADAKVLRHKYNISVIVGKRSILLPNIAYDVGDIRLIKEYLPKNLNFKSNELDDPFDGDIEELNWNSK